MTVIFDRIQKLHAMAEGAAALGNAAEAEMFAAKVQNMLDRHRMDSSILESSEPVEEVERVELQGTDFGYRNGRQKVSWFYVLIRGLCDVNGCRVLTLSGTSVIIVGVRSDREIVQYLSTVLIREMERLLKEWKGALYPHPSRSDCNSWRVGFVYGIRTRLAQQRKTFVDHNPEALVAVNRHAVAVDSMVDSIPHAKKSLHQLVTNRGYEAGKDAAAEVRIHKGTKDGITRRALSS